MPDSVAAPADVVARWRPLTSRQVTVARTKLADAERRIVRRMAKAGRDFYAEVAADEAKDEDDPTKGFKADVIEVEAEAVARVLKNPDGLKSEGLENYQKSRDKSLADGQLRITAEDWQQLGLRVSTRGKAFSVDTTPDAALTPGVSGWYGPDGWATR